MIRRRLIFALALAAWSMFAASASAVTTAQYARTLDSISGQLETARRMDKASGGLALDHIAGTIPSGVEVSQEGGANIRVDLQWVKNSIGDLKGFSGKARARHITALIERINLLKSAARNAPNNSPVSVKQARSTLKRVLAQNEYEPSFLDRLQQAILDFLSRIARSLPVSPIVGEVIFWILVALAIVVFVAVLVYLTLRLVRYYTLQTTGTEPVREKQTTKTKQTAASLVEAAERAAAAGNFREAFRSSYLAAILVLDGAKLVKYADGVTNWEYLRTLRNQPRAELTQTFQEMTHRFDELIYGKRDVAGEDYLACAERLQRLEGML